MIDYAYPTMMAEKALNNLHAAMLLRKYDLALEYALECITEARMAYHSICVMKEEDGKPPVSS
jgi:hypothetical protein